MSPKKVLNPKERIELFHSILGMGKGVDVMDEIMRLFGADTDTFNEDSYKHAYNSGQRAAAIKIKQIVNADLEKYKDAEAKT